MFNIKSLLSSTSLYTFIGIGFTVCMIAGHMDLSVGYMATAGALVVLGMHTLTGLPWAVSILIAVAVGAAVGILNGLLVTKAKIHSFIATLGMQYVIRGGMYIYCEGKEISVKGDYGLTDKLSSVPIKFLPFNVLFIITLICVIGFSIMLAYTRFGRNIYMLGGNLETAWLAGINSDRATIIVFMLSSMSCALGGALFGIFQGTATPTLGEKGIAPLMIAMTATIIGGTDIAGGKGKVLDTFISITAIVAMFSVVTSLLGKFEYQILLIGFVLALILCAALTFSITACGGSEAPANSEAPAADSEEPAADKEAPADPDSLPDDDKDKYFSMEYLDFAKEDRSPNLPESPADGCIGKKVTVIVHGDHAWTNAYMKGWTQAAEALGMEVEILSPNWDQAMQDQLIDQAINSKPDAIVVIPLSAENATQQFRRITEAGIPAFGSNTLTQSDALAYMEAWTGSDDWAQMRILADTLGEELGGKGGICYITHNVGTSPYFARTYGPITEFKEKYPDIKTLDIQSPGFEAAKCKQQVADWITKYGDELNAIFLADDSDQVTGTIDAIKEAGRDDIVVVAAGNSKAGQDAVKAGDVRIINYQSAEGDGGLSARTVAAWFNGEDIPLVGYLTTDMITADNVDSFYPTQW